MGLLIDGVWQTREEQPFKPKGHFERPSSVFRNWVTPDGRPGSTGHDGFARRQWPLSPFCLARLPVGSSHTDHAGAEETLKRSSRFR